MQTRISYKQFVENVGRRIAELRRNRLGLTQEQFAERIKRSVQYLRQIETGRENLTLVSLHRLARYLDISAEEFFKPPTEAKSRPGRPRKADRTRSSRG